jgi:hypothetical protein
MTAIPDAARELVARWEHGDENHRQWLRDVAVPDVTAALFAARDAALREARQGIEALLAAHAVERPEVADHVDFYEREFYPLSNFSAFHLQWSGHEFDTSEAAYQWSKFPHGSGAQSQILFARSAHKAFKIAERRRDERRPDWDEIKGNYIFDSLALFR